MIQALVDDQPPDRVLEVGNVLSHYRDQRHLIIGSLRTGTRRPEPRRLELDGLGRFALIVAISTLEHVGLDERTARSGQVGARRTRAARVAGPGWTAGADGAGGYNRQFDAAIRCGGLPIANLAALRREAGSDTWVQVEPEAAFAAPYDFLLYRARAVVFARLEAVRA